MNIDLDSLTWWFSHVKELVHDLIHLVMIPSVAWLWQERKILKDVLEDKLERRHDGDKGDSMLNPITIVTDINLAVNAITKIQAALPQIQKTVNDLRQALQDKSDTTKLDADLIALMGDVQADLADVAALFPTAPVTTPTPTPPPAAAS